MRARPGPANCLWFSCHSCQWQRQWKALRPQPIQFAKTLVYESSISLCQRQLNWQPGPPRQIIHIIHVRTRKACDACHTVKSNPQQPRALSHEKPFQTRWVDGSRGMKSQCNDSSASAVSSFGFPEMAAGKPTTSPGSPLRTIMVICLNSVDLSPEPSLQSLFQFKLRPTTVEVINVLPVRF
jgi:hypothetical protein